MKKLRIVIITQGVSFIVQPLIDSDNEVIGIVESASRNYNKEAEKTLIAKLKRCYWNLKGKKTLSQFATAKKIPYILLDKNNHEEVARRVREWQPDLMWFRPCPNFCVSLSLVYRTWER